MIFNPEEKVYLLNRLPSLELSYEPKLHKKVYAPAFYLIPKGPKALVWYTYWKEQNVCLLIRINERGNYSDVQVFTTTFSDQLALGTIIYGTYFLHYNRSYFTCEQLHYYKGVSVVKKTFNERLNLLLEMFTSHIDQVNYTSNNSLVMGMPVMTETYEEALAQMDNVPYKIYGIAAAAFGSAALGSAPLGSAALATPFATPFATPLATPLATPFATPFATPLAAPLATPHGISYNNKAVFKVKASLAADNYLLYTAEDTLYETAMVPTYKCSVMLNALFRNIKENANLDLLEESDDEDEFENIQIDKFVDLEKTVPMECVYSKRFKKWQPNKIVLSTHAKIISLKELQYFLKNKI